ncbi:MrcB family domain-containing protein [Larkinella humicola]|uniref:DUF3578 domain-containing protein n=1 Tax=Larkinella humicola TaxID=2607654 RepID=A0A5N1JF34_9BACT|nr:DUF3578 domain-containing protein [Larkinella humicola]KAA9349736.1 DUF3578 domain-containing protein [Larkinella humicola]
MILNEAFEIVLSEYPQAVRQPFNRHPLAKFVRTKIVELITTGVDLNSRYLVRGSTGQGAWARCPWVAIFDRLITESAQKGFYIVYLFKEDYSGLYLSLNQGVTTIRLEYKSDTKKALRIKANDYLARLGEKASGLNHGPIDLSTTSSSTLGADYEAGSICSVYYPINEIPSTDILFKVLSRFLSLYSYLVENDSVFGGTTVEEDEELYFEDLTKIRLHKRIERNTNLALAAKALYKPICQVCGFDFFKHYGEIGKNYIEAHHLTPLSGLKGQRLKLSPSKDFALLCSNCHRMIHRSEFISDIEGFKKAHYKG